MKTYSHDLYRNILKDARIYDGTSNCYFCPDCRRYVPKQDAKAPCIFCGGTRWALENPLTEQIVDTKPLKQYMLETFRNCIEPFTTFDKQKWKNGHIFHKKDTAQRCLSETRDYFLKEKEIWCVSNRGFKGYFLSMCVRWVVFLPQDNDPAPELTYFKYLTLRSPDICADYNEGKDDEFYLDLVFDEYSTSPGDIYRVCFQAIGTDKKKYTEYVDVSNGSESMLLRGNSMMGGFDYDYLLKGGLGELMTCLSDFSLIPRYWGYGE